MSSECVVCESPAWYDPKTPVVEILGVTIQRDSGSGRVILSTEYGDFTQSFLVVEDIDPWVREFKRYNPNVEIKEQV